MLSFSNWCPTISIGKNCYTAGTRGQGGHPYHKLAWSQRYMVHFPVYRGRFELKVHVSLCVIME